MSTDYNYDEKAQFFPYFILVIVGLATAPVTYSWLKPSKEIENTAPRIQSDFQPPEAELIEKQRRKQKRLQRKTKRMVASLLGLAIMGYMVYLIIVTARTIPKIWDPFEILDIARSSSEKQIKSRYRKLSLLFHPDKVKIDPSKNITVESANAHWVEVTKAFKSLTDEEIRKNWLEFGHPDGRQSTSIGIALPQFIVTEGNGKYVLLVYGALLGTILPYLVGKWWYGTQRMTRDKILVSSAGSMFTQYEDEMTVGNILTALSSGAEFEEMLNADSGSSKIEKLVLEDTEQVLKAGMNEADKLKLKHMNDAKRKKALALLWAYMGRIDLEDAALNEEKYEVAPTAFALNESFISIALAYGNYKPLVRAYHIGQTLIQGMPPFAPPLLQLPHFTPSIIRAVEKATSHTDMSVQEFMNLPDNVRRKLVVGPSLMSEQQYTTAKAVAAQIPAMSLEAAWFKVAGEKIITPSSLVQFVVKTRIIPPGLTPVPEVYTPDLEDIDPKEDDVDALNGRKKTKVMTKDGKVVEQAADAEVQPLLTHAPYFARDHSPRWRLFLAENKSGKIAVPPFTFNTFDRPLFDEDGKPTCNVQTLKMQFQAPPGAGDYMFTMNLVCDSYVGLDIKKDVTLTVAEASEAVEIEEEEEISEPEEDSLAGQMNALKGGAAPTKRKIKRPAEDEDDDSDGSNTEGEEDEDDASTDTDTDTSDEE